MGGFLTGFFGAGGQEALEHKHHQQQQQDMYRNAQLQSLLHMRDIAAQNGASQDILDQFNKSIGELQPGYHAPKGQAPAQPQQAQTAVPSLTLPGQANVPLVGESPNVDITGNTPVHANAPADASAPQTTPTPQLTPVSAPQPGVFMKGGAIPKPTAPDNTPITPPAVTANVQGPTIPGQAGPTVTNNPMTLSRAIAEANDPRLIAMKQAYVKQIESQAAFEQQQKQFQQNLDLMEPILRKNGLDDKAIQQIKQDAALQFYAPRALMMMGRVPRPYAAGALDINGAIALSENGQDLYGRDGQPIDLGYLRANFPNAQLVPVYGPGGQVYYDVSTQPTKTATFDNQVVQIPSRGTVGPENENVLGQKQVSTTTTRQVPSAGGGTLTLNSTRTPQTPNKTAPTPASPTGAPVLKTRGNQTAKDYQGNALSTDDVVQPQKTESGGAAPGGTASGKKATGASVGKFIKQANDAQLAKQVQTQGIEPDMNKLFPQQGTAARKALPALVATRGLFGDPERPELPTLSDFSDLANDPHAQRVLGAAFKLMESTPIELENPSGITDGTLATIAADNGFKNWQAQVMAKVQQQALKDATPRELQYFNAAVNGMADVIGMRGATGQNAAKWSVQTMQNELPLIGTIGTKNQQAYLQKLMSLNSQAGNIINTMPDNGRAKYWLHKRENDLKALQQQAAPGPKNPQQGNDTVKMRAPNGDVRYVTPDQVSHYEKLGATVVK